MKKLITGIVDFRHKTLPSDRERFARLALDYQPDVLFVACSDSRVVPNLFASTAPGDLFVIRNVGNLIPPCGVNGLANRDRSEAAAVEFSVLALKVPDIIVCGHSECGAMRTVAGTLTPPEAPHLQEWLKHVRPAAAKLRAGRVLDASLSEHNQLSQLNVLQQMEHLMSYAAIEERVKSGNLRIHGWWYDIRSGEVHCYEPDQDKFILIDDEEAARLTKRLG